ncbi:arginine/serine-rich coiled-coil protein 2-like isoform X2 [Penaeus japonicus]|uniref:arginine/serine-rich coiled-coil protein 2-like isoform X2 n=1 Tax=Penaeus japonicus TaxID=27405 RepID=UPI001C714EAC|nr:arginine/serine-rich coiled-coil protein 2-like isoform X2 [Penaeus japonicus]
MNALQSYSSDDESGGEVPEKKSHKCGDPGTNYDDVGMDISEDSEDELQQNPKANSANSSTRQSSVNNCAPSHGLPSSSPTSAKSSATDNKDGQRSSLQERLLGLASGGRRISQDDRGGQRENKDSSSSNTTASSTLERDANPPSKSRSKSPVVTKPSKARSPKPRSPGGGGHRSRHKTRSRSKSRERDSGRSGQQGRDHTSRSHISQGHSGRNRDSRDVRRSRDDDRKRRDDERRSRRSRSRSRSRERRRSRSRSRDRRSRSRSRERRRRSRSRERKRPMDIRKVFPTEAQQKLAALKAANPDLTAAELLRRSMEAQVEEVQKQTGITLPSYYNPAAMNPMKFAEQERKKKLLWGNKSKPDGTSSTNEGTSSLYGSLGSLATQSAPMVLASVSQPKPEMSAGPLSGATGSGQASLWANTKFSNDRDGKMAEKFRRLMGVKNAAPAEAPPVADPKTSKEGKDVDLLQKQETMFTSMERQYEMARLATHTHKGFGLGFTSQSFMPK